MPQFNNLQLLNELQQQTETFLQTAVQQWQVLPTQQLLQQPGPGSWSVAQCLAHLNSYGRYYLPALQQSIDLANQNRMVSEEIFKTSWLGNFFTELMLPKGASKGIKKMKAPKNHTPSPLLNGEAVIAEFIGQQEKMLQLLENAKTINLRRVKTPVSISRFIRLPIGDTFRFLIAHNYRHMLQAQRALATTKNENAER